MREPACYDFGTNMPHSTRTFRIAIASSLALLMVGGAYAFSGPNPLFGLGRIAEAQSAEELLKEYAAKDTDFDGLPDWQEALYGTDPANPESFQAGIKDGDAVAQGLIEPKVAVREDSTDTNVESIPGASAAPSSLTDRFAQTLLKQYLQNRGENPPTQEEIVEFVKAGVAELTASSASPDRYGTEDLVAGGSGTAALKTYAAAAEGVFLRIAVPAEKNELFFFSDAIKGEEGALDEIDTISRTYSRIAVALMEIPVPSEARQSHLMIANAISHLAETSADMAAMDEDPLRALMGISLHTKYSEDWIAAFAGMSRIFSAAGVTLPAEVQGSSFIETSNAAAQAAR